jgi:sec-independent protein translocase protein TatC
VTKTAAEDQPQSILAHLEELRWRIVKSAIAIVVGAVIALVFADQIRAVLVKPYDLAVPGNPGVIALTPTEQFGVLMRIAFFGGLVIASPVVFYQIWAFVNPALTKREKRWAVPIVSAFVLLFLAGIAFAFWILPRGLAFLLTIFDDVQSQLRIGDYFSFVIRFLLVFGVAFQYPVFLFAVAAAGLITARQLARGRRWAILIIVVVGAMITPTGDPLTLLALSVPLYLFYEITYWLVRLVLRR